MAKITSKLDNVRSACGRCYEVCLYSDGSYAVRQIVPFKGASVRRRIANHKVAADALRQIAKLRDQFVAQVSA